MVQTVDPSFYKVLEGHFSEPPKPPAKVVRVFLSSTFTDYSVERNALIQRVYPAIKRYCRERYGTDFQVVDMRWGIRQEAQDDHRENDICLKEIATAQRVSAGPNFILLLGQRYGTKSLNHLIPADEFEMFRDVWTQQQVEHVNSELMATWFKRDDNAVPPVYVLQRISSILPNYMAKDEETSESDRAEWRRIESIIYDMLKQAAEECSRAGNLNEERLKVYTVSVTEREIISGVLNAPDVSRRVLVFDRLIDAIDLNHAKAGRFVDMIGQHVDEEARHAVSRVRDQVLAAVDKKNVFQYRVPWSTKGGIDEGEHAQYIDDFCDKFRDECIRLIDDARRSEGQTEDPLVTEVAEHARHCYESVRVFMGREELIDKMRDFTLATSSEVPLVVHGESGSGKTSVMAKSAMECHSWLGDTEHTRVILRFLGTTPTSSSILTTLRSICMQIISLYALQHVPPLPDDMDQLQLYFSELLFKVPSDDKLCIFLDSIDQLSMANNAHDLLWVPRKIPPNVKMIFSVLPGGILDRFEKLSSSWAFLEVNVLAAETSIGILLAWFHKINRQLTADQQRDLVQHLQGIECLPLQIKLIFDKISTIASFESLTQVALPKTVRESIVSAFTQLMAEHGERLVSHALGYVTLSKNGISELELEDLLSLDDDVLGDVYQFHLPSVRRLPSILWTRIRQDIEDYIVEREADGVSVIYWYHRQFIEVATSMFGNAGAAKQLCQLMAEYFLGTWSGKAKTFEYSEYWMKKMGITFAESERGADRHVPEQSMETVVADVTGKKIVRYNRRKVSMILHLIKSCAEMKVPVSIGVNDFFINYEFLHAIFCTRRWEVIDIISVIDGISDFGSVPDLEMTLVTLFGTLLTCVAHVNDYPHNLAAQLCGRMLAHYGFMDPLIKFMDICDELGPRHCALVSPHQQLPIFNGGEIFSTKRHNTPIQLVARTFGGQHIGTLSSQVLVVLLFSEAFKASYYTLPNCEQSFHRLYLYGDDSRLFPVVASPKAFFVLSEDQGCIIFSHEIPTDDAATVCDLVAVGSCIAVSYDNKKEVEVYNFKEKKLVARLESPRDSGCVKKLVDAPLFYDTNPIDMFWMFWENGDLTCHDPDNLSAPAILEQVGVPVKCTSWAGETKSVLALLDSGMLVSFRLSNNSIEHYVYCLRQRLPDDCYNLCSPDGQSVLLCCRNSVHMLKFTSNSAAVQYPVLQGSYEETYDHAMIDKAGSTLYLSRQGIAKSLRIVPHERGLRFDVIQVFEAHFRSITAMLPHAIDDKYLVTAAEDGIIKGFLAKDKPSLNVEFDRSEANMTKMVPQKSAVITIDETRSCATVWDILRGKVASTLNITNVYDTALSEDEKTVAVSTTTGSVALFQLSDANTTGEPQTVINTKTPSNLFYSSAVQSFVAQTSEHVHLISASDFHVDSLNVATDLSAPSCLESSTLVALSADQGSVVIVSLTRKSVTGHIPVYPQQHIQSFCMANDNSIFLLSVSQQLTRIGVSKGDITSVDEHVICISKVPTAFAWMKEDAIQICSLPAFTALQSIELEASKQYAHLCLTPDGQYIVYAALPLELHLRRVMDGALLGVYCMYVDICMLAISVDSQFVLTATKDRRLFVLLIADPDVPEHLERIKALPSRTLAELDDEVKQQRMEQLEHNWEQNRTKQKNAATNEAELDEEDAKDFIMKQECSRQPGWALNTKFIYDPSYREQEPQHPEGNNDSSLKASTNESLPETTNGENVTDMERALAEVVTTSQACSVM